jgi:hypothetical protein
VFSGQRLGARTHGGGEEFGTVSWGQAAVVCSEVPGPHVSDEDMLSDRDKLAVRTIVYGTPADGIGEPEPTIMEDLPACAAPVSELADFVGDGWP